MAKFSKTGVFDIKVNQLFEMIVTDSLKEFNKSLSMSDEEIRHTKLTKKYKSKKKEIESHLEISKFEKNQVYEVTTVLNKDIYIVRLDFVPQGENKTAFTYTEIIRSLSPFRNLNYVIVGFLSKGRFNRKITYLFNQLSERIKKEK